LLAAGIELRCLRDLTRGGLASALNEIATTRGVGISIEESLIPVREAVHGACEILGLDPLYVANEGRMVIFVPAAEGTRALQVLHGVPVSQDAVRVGVVAGEGKGAVVLKSRIGGSRVVDLLSGEQLPRIC
jgi:hydrogenase expression/formation protein HypE